MTSDPCSYTITQKSVSVTGSGDCVVINFGQLGDKSCINFKEMVMKKYKHIPIYKVHVLQ